MARTAVVTDRRYLRHFAGRGHPERPERLSAMIDMAEAMAGSEVALIAPRAAERDEIALCHDPAFIEEVERTRQFDRFAFDADTYTSRDSFDAAVLAAGGVLTAIEAVLAGEVENAFALVRPPGHHALAARAMGFCLFNNVAIGAAWLARRRGLSRVAIVDWDVHHGNGTQEIFYDSSQVLYLSAHQFPYYPGTGSLYEVGVGAGTGFTVNLAMPAGFGDAEYLHGFDAVFMPVLRSFKPEFILVSAGFDCHFRDPLGAMEVSEQGFAGMARRLRELAAESCGGRLVLVLEGGYDLQALVASGRAVLDELRGEVGESPSHPVQSKLMAPLVEQAWRVMRNFWSLG
jgi:acetoin utilization deacetylase AcuC-like enzyme